MEEVEETPGVHILEIKPWSSHRQLKKHTVPSQANGQCQRINLVALQVALDGFSIPVEEMVSQRWY